MWSIECSNDGKTVVKVVKAKGKLDASIKRANLLSTYNYVWVFDDDGEYVDPCEL